MPCNTKAPCGCAKTKKAETKANLTAASIAKELGVSDGKVKKAIEELGIEPAEKKGACSYYPHSAVSKIKAALD